MLDMDYMDKNNFIYRSLVLIFLLTITVSIILPIITGPEITYKEHSSYKYENETRSIIVDYESKETLDIISNKDINTKYFNYTYMSIKDCEPISILNEYRSLLNMSYTISEIKCKKDFIKQL